MQQSSLRTKIITWSFVPTAIILVAVALVSIYAYQRVTENLVIERDRELTRLSAEMLAEELATYTNPLADQYLAIFDAVLIFDANGTVLTSEPRQYEEQWNSWFSNISLQKMLNSGQPVFSNIVADRLNGEEVVVAIMPISVRAGEPRGGLAGFFRLGPRADHGLSSSIDKLRRGETGRTYLVDGRGRVIYHPDPAYIGADFSTLGVIQAVTGGQIGALHTQDFEGQEIVASFAPVPGTSWGLVAEESWAALTESSRRYSRFLFLLLALGIVTPALIVATGVRRITQPIAELIQAAREIASGNFERRIKAPTGDELESLAEQFNCMAGRLQESYADLELKVAGRTRELATLNAIAAQVSQSLDLSRILDNALDEVLAVMAMEQGLAFCLDQDGETLILVARRGIGTELAPPASQVHVTDGPIGQAIKCGQPVVSNGVQPDGLDTAGTGDSLSYALTVCIPLMSRGRALGMIQVAQRAPRLIAPEELSLLAAIGNQIGVAVENARLYEQAQQLAVIHERNRLARDLHDSVMQALYGVTLYAEAAARQLGNGDSELAAGHLVEIRRTTQEALREMRLLIFELRPPILTTVGLAAALQARLEAVEGRVGIATEFAGAGDCRLAPGVEEGLYRVAQEALNNTLKYALANHVRVQLKGNGQTVRLEIADDGIGFDLEEARRQGGFGLHSMEERVARLGGKIAIRSQPGRGTTITVEVGR